MFSGDYELKDEAMADLLLGRIVNIVREPVNVAFRGGLWSAMVITRQIMMMMISLKYPRLRSIPI